MRQIQIRNCGVPAQPNRGSDPRFGSPTLKLGLGLAEQPTSRKSNGERGEKWCLSTTFGSLSKGRGSYFTSTVLAENKGHSLAQSSKKAIRVGLLASLCRVYIGNNSDPHLLPFMGFL